MENAILNGQELSAAYDYRLYDRVWKRVSPDMDPYGTETSGGSDAPEVSSAPVPASPPAQTPTAASSTSLGAAAEEANLPGADRNPCCMGTDAQDSLEVLEGFLEEELAGRRHCMALASCVHNQSAARLMHRAASEKQAAVRELCAAYYLITGKRYTAPAAVEHLQFESLADALRSCYHQEACNGFNYQRSSEETMDVCLRKLFARLGEQSYRRSEEIMALLGKLLC